MGPCITSLFPFVYAYLMQSHYRTNMKNEFKMQYNVYSQTIKEKFIWKSMESAIHSMLNMFQVNIG